MTSLRYAVRALVLSLALTAAGAFCVLTPATATGSGQVGNPIGGQQLAAPGVIVNLAPGVPPPPAMPGASYLLADMDTGQILVAKAPHAPHLPASTLKTLTALTLIPILDKHQEVVVKPEDVKVDGTRVGILAGAEYTVQTLLQGMLISSGNDAAYALARSNQSVAATLQQMNAMAADLGAADTVAKDPSGLDKAGQQTSAYDLALIGRAAMELPDFRGYVMTKQVSLPAGRSVDGKLKKPGFTISNHNLLLHNYKSSIGIKNGYTVAAKFTYVEAATRGGKTYLLTEMASPNNSWRPAAAMFDWAFAHASSLTPVGILVEPGDPSAAKPFIAAVGRPRAPTEAPTATPTAAPTVPETRTARRPAFTPWVGVAGGIGVAGGFGALAVGWSFVRRSTARKRL